MTYATSSELNKRPRTISEVMASRTISQETYVRFLAAHMLTAEPGREIKEPPSIDRLAWLPWALAVALLAGILVGRF